ncbi:MAG: prepilin-type N-terminal cleavage/methylation domain-containing protein [Verrucomicrobiota bacterium]
MNPSTLFKTKQAFTLLELLVVIAIVSILFMMIAPMRYTGDRLPAKTGQCMSNLKQIGIGFVLYFEDNSNQPPWQASTPVDRTAADCFLKLTSYLQPKYFICPSDSARQAATTNYSGFSNTNLSYFASLQSSLTSTSNFTTLVLAGDRHLALNNQPVKTSLLNVTNATELSWTKELHFTKNSSKPVGILLFADGHVARTRTHDLSQNLASPDRSSFRLLIP